MTTRRVKIALPQDLVMEIDKLVGPRARNAFLIETTRREIRRQKLLRFLSRQQPAWKDENHPELKRGTAKWVRKLRFTDDRSRSKNF